MQKIYHDNLCYPVAFLLKPVSASCQCVFLSMAVNKQTYDSQKKKQNIFMANVLAYSSYKKK